MRVAVVGSGYVGLVAGACFADSGNDVVCVDVDEKKIAMLSNGQIPIYEPGLEDLVKRNHKEGRLKFTTSLKQGVTDSDIIFIAVGTPQDEDGSADLSQVLSVASEIGKHMNGHKTIVDKSTVPVGTAKLVEAAVAKQTKHTFDVVSNPEFLKEGAAIEDFMRPDRVVIGVPNSRSEKAMKELYAPFVRNNHPILVMDVASAEITKYASNAMLATRVSFMNEIANLCERVGANIEAVRVGIGTDQRIGMPFLHPGIGYGGSCFPKDVQALIRTGKDLGMDMRIPVACEEINKAQKGLIVKRILAHYKGSIKGKHFAVWGLAFKPKTDDTREAPALTVVKELLDNGAKLTLFDPEAMKTFAWRLGDHPHAVYASGAYQALQGADALVVCTEWGAFRQPDFDKIKSELSQPVIFDGRNLYDVKSMAERGFTYYSIGRPVGVPAVSLARAASDKR